MGKAIIAGAFLLCLLVPSGFYNLMTVDTATATVTSKERVCDGGKEGDCRWMILTDQISLKNTDTLWHFKFNSTDIQGSVVVGKEYTFTYYGWRLPLLRVYPNIIKVQ